MKKLLNVLSIFLLVISGQNVLSCKKEDTSSPHEIIYNWGKNKDGFSQSDWLFKKKDIKNIDRPKINTIDEDINIEHYKFTVNFNNNEQSDKINNKTIYYSVDSLIFYVDSDYYNGINNKSFKRIIRSNFMDSWHWYSGFFEFENYNVSESLTLNEVPRENDFGLSVECNKTIRNH